MLNTFKLEIYDENFETHSIFEIRLWVLDLLEELGVHEIPTFHLQLQLQQVVNIFNNIYISKYIDR